MRNFLEKYHFGWRCWKIVFGILALVYSFYMAIFFLGNHDWHFLRYGTPLSSGVWEARLTQFVLPVVLFSGHVLPILGTLIGFMFFTAAAVLLAQWYGIFEKKVVVVVFSLLIVLHPYVCSQLYYVHSVISVMAWYFFTVLGVVFLWNFIDNKRLLCLFMGCLLLLFALCGYAACIEAALTITIGKFLLDVSAEKKINMLFIKKYCSLWVMLVLIFLLYGGIIFVAKKYNIIDKGMYNTQTLSFREIFGNFFNNFYMPFDVLAEKLPYCSLWGNVILVGLFIIFLLSIKSNRLLVIAGIFCLIYAMFCVAYISPQNVFHMFRIHVYSVPYFAAILFAFIVQNGDNKYKNIAFVLGMILIFLFLKADLIAQKVWYLGNKQDDALVERVKHELLPQLEPNKHYRLSTIGNLYGRQKFAGIRFASDGKMEAYREYWGGAYFLSIFFSAGFWGYEAENPIWGDALYFSHAIFYGTSNENIDKKDVIISRLFARTFGDDKLSQISPLRKLKPFPQRPYYAIGNKDIFLMFEDKPLIKDMLIENMKKDK